MRIVGEDPQQVASAQRLPTVERRGGWQAAAVCQETRQAASEAWWRPALNVPCQSWFMVRYILGKNMANVNDIGEKVHLK